jgi:SapC
MANWVKLDNVDHAELVVARRHGAAFGDAVNQVLVFPTEFEQVQRDYPILFRREDGGRFYAVALLGLDLDENLFLADGAWTARYVPVLQQRGPFTADPTGGLPLIDLDDARVGADDGEPLFLPHGGSTPYLQHVTAVIEAIGHGRNSIAPFFTALDELGLLRARALDVQLGDGASYTVADVFTLDEARLADLPAAALVPLHRSGMLRAATMAAASLGNVARLIELKNARRG